MNILIQQTRAFPHHANSFYWSYAQLAEWLTAHGIDSKLYFSYLELADSEFENGLLLPDHYPQFYTPRSIEVICELTADKKTNVILDYSHVITGDTRRYYFEIKKRNPSIEIFTMIHNCPNHTTQLKRYELLTFRFKDVCEAKQFFQWMLPQLYINLLKKAVSHQNRSAYDMLDEVVLPSPVYIPGFRKLIGKKDARGLFATPNAIQPIRSVVPAGQKDKEIIFMGRMATEEASPRLLKVWEVIQDKLPDWELTLVEGGPRFNTCRQIIREKELKRVRLTGRQMSIPYISHVWIICLTSVIEGLPAVFTEAMSLGVIPIGSDSFNAVYDTIDDGVDGFTIPDNNYKQYAAAILRLAGDNTLRCRIAYKAQTRKNRYDIEHVDPLWMDIFRRHGLI